MYLETLIATMAIDAYEDRSVVFFDIPGVYLNADMPTNKFVVMKFEEQFINIIREKDLVLKVDTILKGKKSTIHVNGKSTIWLH